MRLLIASLLACYVGSAAAAGDTLVLDAAQAHRLGGVAAGAIVNVEGLPDGFGGSATLRFERIDIYAPGAKVIRVDAAGEHEVPRSPRIHLIGATADGSVRASLSFDPGLANVTGFGSTAAGAFSISGERGGSGLRLRARPTVDTLPPGVVPQTVPSDDGVPSGRPDPSALQQALAVAAPTGAARIAVVAVDTDNEFMSLRFSNNTAAATTWLGDLFAAMNVMYNRDLGVTLHQGTTFLRTTTDPYSLAAGMAANNADLTQFGTYWQGHYANVARSFALLLSGVSSGGNPAGDSASGIAWINAYCQTQSQGGSYSVEKIFTDPNVGISYSALIVGHELGHNFGAYHTHCTNASSGSAPTASNTIDKCYSGESGCYSGATSCPGSGPGAPAGTVMSYCNLQGCNGGANVLQFHPTQITVLNALVAQNTPSCLAADTDEIFASGFE